MPDPVIAITSGIALFGASQSRKTAKEAQSSADEQSEAELEFQQARVDDWKAVYGDIQQNLSDYYTNLTPDKYEVMGLEAIEKEKARSLELIGETFAQRGLSGSGLATSAEVGLEFQTMQQRADVRRSAPGVVADEKMRFLQVGLGQDPSDSYAQTLSQQAHEARGRADTANRSSAAALQSGLTTVGTALSDYYGKEGE